MVSWTRLTFQAGANACINYFQNGLNGKLGDGEWVAMVGCISNEL
jgi:hypothetical protein